MADNQVRNVLEWVLKAAGLDGAVARLRKVREQVAGLKKDGGLLDQALGKVGKQIAGVFGGAAVLAIFKQSIGEFAAYERSLRGIGAQLDGLGKKNRVTATDVDTFLQQIERTTGALRQDTAPAFQKLLGLTEDANAAMAATALAAGISKSGLKDTAEAGQLLGAILQGELIEPAKSLGVQLRKANGEMKTSDEVINELVGRFGDLGGATQDTQGFLDQLGAEWNNWKQSIGKGSSEILKWVGESLVGAFSGLRKRIQSIGPAVLWAFAQAAGAVQGTVGVIGAAWDAVTTLDFSGFGEKVTAAWKAGRGQWSAEAEGAADELRAIWADAGPVAAKDYTAGFDKIREIARRKAQDDAKKDAAKAAQDAKKKAEEQAKAERQAALEVQALRVQIAKEGTAERLAAELKYLDMQRDNELANTELTEAAKAAIREKYRLASDAMQQQALVDSQTRMMDALAKAQEEIGAILQAENDARADLRDADLANLETHLAQAQEIAKLVTDQQLQTFLADVAQRQELEQQALDAEYSAKIAAAELIGADTSNLEKAYQAKSTAIAAKASQARTDLEKAQLLNRVAVTEEALGYLSTIAGAFFGKSKSLAIALALMDTAAAVVKALASVPWPLNILAAAATAAQGYANVQKIRDTKVGGGGGAQGFDDPNNDSAAIAAGRRWAHDWVAKTSLGFTDGLRESLSSTAAQGAGGAAMAAGAGGEGVLITGNGHTFVGGRAGLRQLIRNEARESRRQRGRRVR